MRQLERLDLTKLFPPFVGLLATLVVRLEQKGHIFFATSGFRSFEEQDALFKKGGVTNARGGFSAHNFGVAVDLCADEDEAVSSGLQPVYLKARYEVLGEVATDMGLEWGGSWQHLKDAPHVQLPLQKNSFGWEQLRKLYEAGGIELVWRELSKVEW